MFVYIYIRSHTTPSTLSSLPSPPTLPIRPSLHARPSSLIGVTQFLTHTPIVDTRCLLVGKKGLKELCGYGYRRTYGM